MSRRDDISKMYRFPNLLSKASNLLFILNAAVAVITQLWPNSIKSFLVMAQVFFVLSYVLISVVDDAVFWFNAEAIRRINCIEDAFSVDLSENKTEGYYNNAVHHPIVRYALNNYESAYYSLNISKKMLPKAIFKACVALIIFLISLRAVKSGDIILLIVQTLFSSAFILDSVVLFFYVYRVGKVCNCFYTLLISTGGPITQSCKALLLSYSVEYEAIKAFHKIRLDEKIFLKDRDDLAARWDELLKKSYLPNK